ncbi:MAG: prepilin-type N-terminal cleavage/methylation domain-containing protein [Gammaproteobacteria bacterium]|nr:prepilin-type N-terminal cleavage/methylation domain-containing protein [Gammaproteobacteria bacterium]
MSFNSVAAHSRPRGYTLIELVLVIVIAGILATIAGPRFFDLGVFTQRAYGDELAAALRSAQKAAVASDCPAQVTVTDSGYTVDQQAAAGNACDPTDTRWDTPVVGADGTPVQGKAPAGTVVSPIGSFVFAGSGALSSAPAAQITVGPDTIRLDASTGFVQSGPP